ncbi:cytochrome P450 [Actinomadura darangshiensis]|uniref:Cytochrome P450 n=1 Tax=Actinomadura darangshiensis TaxID=705336 RepID=A0A4R5BBR0_9ACTN|nr:cytochrome P450 [Actinomadura darangshiensis]TDD83511.1 cytochrome P450 [Actinomadura darangshiensis]
MSAAEREPVPAPEAAGAGAAAEPDAAPGGRRTPPGPPRRAMPGIFAKLVRDRLGLMMDATTQYGDAVRVAAGPKTLYIFNHPRHAKRVLADNAGNYHKGIGLAQARRALGDGLLTSEGERWRAQRRTVQPAFRQSRIAAQAGAVAEEAAGLVRRLREHAGRGPVELMGELTGLTLGVLGRTLLDADLSAHGGIGEAFEAVQDQAMFDMVTLSAVPPWTPLPKQLRFRRARAELARVVDRLVAERTARGADGDDALALLIAAARSAADPEAARRRLHDELITLLLAGHETTASTLGWSLYLIDRHPDVARRLHEEAVAVLGDRLPEYADLHRLTYTGMVIEEVMRLYPPVWILTRTALAADEVGGYHVPAGADVLIAPYTLHRNPAFWQDPERFEPERFAPGNATARPRYAYIPFGAGPRFCVGNHLGMLEATFVLALIARELRLSVPPGHRVVPEPMLSLRMRGGLPMNIRLVESGGR